MHNCCGSLSLQTHDLNLKVVFLFQNFMVLIVNVYLFLMEMGSHCRSRNFPICSKQYKTWPRNKYQNSCICDMVNELVNKNKLNSQKIVYFLDYVKKKGEGGHSFQEPPSEEERGARVSFPSPSRECFYYLGLCIHLNLCPKPRHSSK